jgi:hypothetical protein
VVVLVMVPPHAKPRDAVIAHHARGSRSETDVRMLGLSSILHCEPLCGCCQVP